MLGLTGMAKALEEQRRQPDVAALPFEERLALLVDREAIERENKRLVSRLKFAGLRQNAAIEDLDTKAVRGLDKALFARLAAGDWIARRENSDHPRQNRARQKLACLRTRPQGLPRRSLRALPSRPPPVRCARARTRRWPPRPAAQDHRAGRAPHPRRRGLANVTAEQGHDVLEILDDRQGRGSTIVTSQVDVKHWHDMIANPTVADAILDRLVHNAHRLSLVGESLRKAATQRAALDAKAPA